MSRNEKLQENALKIEEFLKAIEPWFDAITDPKTSHSIRYSARIVAAANLAKLIEGMK